MFKSLQFRLIVQTVVQFKLSAEATAEAGLPAAFSRPAQKPGGDGHRRLDAGLSPENQG